MMANGQKEDWNKYIVWNRILQRRVKNSGKHVRWSANQNKLKPLTIFAGGSTLDVWQSSEYVSGLYEQIWHLALF